MTSEPFVHPTATVEPGASLGAATRVWHHAHVRAGATLGDGCIVGKGAYVGTGVHVGAGCKIQNEAKVYEGAHLEDGVFVGPGACLANDRAPRAVNPDLSVKSASDWKLGSVHIEHGASVGAMAVVVPDARIGRWAMIGAGSVVVGDVAPHTLVVGNPARAIGYVCACGRRLRERAGTWTCDACGRTEDLPPLGDTR